MGIFSYDVLGFIFEIKGLGLCLEVVVLESLGPETSGTSNKIPVYPSREPSSGEIFV